MTSVAWFFLGCFAGVLTREFITAIITVGRYRTVQRIEALNVTAVPVAPDTGAIAP